MKNKIKNTMVFLGVFVLVLNSVWALRNPYEDQPVSKSVLGCGSFPCILRSFGDEGLEKIRERFSGWRDCLLSVAHEQQALIDSLEWFVPREFGKSYLINYGREDALLRFKNEQLIKHFVSKKRRECFAAFKR